MPLRWPAVLLLLALGPTSPPPGASSTDDRSSVLSVICAFVRVSNSQYGLPKTELEAYPIAVARQGLFEPAIVYPESEPEKVSPLQLGSSVHIYKNGKRIGKLQVERFEPRPYFAVQVLVGMGQWSLPSSYYPTKFDASVKAETLKDSIYTWSDWSTQSEGPVTYSLLPLLAFDRELPSRDARAVLSPERTRIAKDALWGQARQLAAAAGYRQRLREMKLEDFRSFDLNADGIPEVVGSFYLPPPPKQDPWEGHSVLVVLSLSSTPKRLFGQVAQGVGWWAFEAIDTDNDGWCELFLTGRGYEFFGFSILKTDGKTTSKVFEGADFGG